MAKDPEAKLGIEHC